MDNAILPNKTPAAKTAAATRVSFPELKMWKRQARRLKAGGSQDWLPHRTAEPQPKPGGRNSIAHGASRGFPVDN
jgi:hypothetical protein